MNNQRQSGRSDFGPRPRMSIRKVADGLSLRRLESRFRSKNMVKIDKECQKHAANVKYMNLCKSHHDQQSNVVKKQAKNISPRDGNVGPSNDLVAKNSKSKKSLASKHSWQHSPLGFRCSKPSRVWNTLPSRKVEMSAPWRSKDDSNDTSRCLEQSHHLKTKDGLICNMESSHSTHLKATSSSTHKGKNVDTSNLNNNALGSRSKDRSNPYQGEDINVGKDGTKCSKPAKKREFSRKSNSLAVSGLLVANKDDSNKEKGRKNVLMTKEKGMIDQTSEGRVTFGNRRKQIDTTKTIEAPNSSSLLVRRKHVQGFGSNLGDNSSNLTGKNHSRHQRDNASFMGGSNCAGFSSKHVVPNEKLPNRVQLVGGNRKTYGDKIRRKEQPLLEEKTHTHGGTVVQQDLTYRPRKRCRSIKDNEDEEDNGGDQHAVVVEHGECLHREKMTFVPMMKWGRCIETNKDEVYGGYQNPFGVNNDCEGVEQFKPYKSKKKRRKDIETNKYEDEMYDQHRMRVEDGTNELTQVAISKHCVEQQRNCCSKPMDKPRWRVIFKIDGKEYISLAGHLSTKSCEKVRKLTLPNVVQVTKVPRLAAWPKIWNASKPTGDSIGVYFFPHEMRHDEELYQLVKEVMDKDLALQAVIDEAEMLIFPSVLLPERHQTFQTKHYIWGAFKAKEDKGVVAVEQEEDKETQHVSSQLDEVQSEQSDQEMILWKYAKPLEDQQLSARSIREVETCCIQGPTNMGLECEAPEERRLRDSLHQAVCNSASTAIATDATTVANAATVPSEFAANTASFPANHGPMDPRMESPPCSSSVFSIVIRKTKNVESKAQQFIQDIRSNGAQVAVIQGEVVPASSQAISQLPCSSCRK